MNKKRIVSMALAMIMCVGIGIGGTLAWLTATTKEVTNTFFATGLIDPDPDPEGKPGGFELWEHEADRRPDGTYKLDMSKEVKNNKYKVVPNNELKKDPFVRVKYAEAGYLYIEVVGTLPTTMTWSVDAGEWSAMEGVTGKNGGQVYKCNRGVIAPGKTQEVNILTGGKIDVSKDFDPNTMTKETTLVFYAYAAQSTGFSSAEDAWAATFGAPATQP